MNLLFLKNGENQSICIHTQP